jgi:two-component SAPR family response regulator
MRFGLLGSLEASREDGPISLGGPKQRIVLAHLVLAANRVVSAEHLIDALWGEELPEDPKSTLQVYVSRLRSALGPDAVEAQAPGYLLRADRDEVDALRFEDLLGAARGNGSDPRVTGEILAEALELWRGPRTSSAWKSSACKRSRRRSTLASSSAVTSRSSRSSKA